MTDNEVTAREKLQDDIAGIKSGDRPRYYRENREALDRAVRFYRQDHPAVSYEEALQAVLAELDGKESK